MKLIKRFLFNLVLSILLIVLLGVGCILTLGYVSYKQIVAQAPVVETIDSIMEREYFVSYDELSPYLVDATIAIEDRDFFNHAGIDMVAIIRSFISNVSTGTVVSGGSTITQQLAKNLYYDFDYDFLRKVSEIFFAYEIETNYTKEEILAVYMNIINYGDNHMGIYEASYGYFNKAPMDLGLTEASLVVGIPQSPSNYQLSDHLPQALEKQKLVLKAMLECDMLNDDDKIYIRDLYGVRD